MTLDKPVTTYAVLVHVDPPGRLWASAYGGGGGITWHAEPCTNLDEALRDLAVAEAENAGLPYDVVTLIVSGSPGSRVWDIQQTGGNTPLFKMRWDS